MKAEGSPTKVMFDSLVKLYKQGQLLLLDADRLMGEREWMPMDTTGPAEFSNLLNLPERWYARWAVRFYGPEILEEKGGMTDRLLFISIHFASDHDTDVDQPVVSAGRLLYDKAVNKKTADDSYAYWICKAYFWGEPHETLEGWKYLDRPRFAKYVKRIEAFTVPLYDITSREKLEKLVVDRLLAAEKET